MRNTIMALFGTSIFLLLLLAVVWIIKANNYQPEYPIMEDKLVVPDATESKIETLYEECKLEDKLDFEIFRRAMMGYFHLPLLNNDVITIIDYSKASTEERFYLIDLRKKRLLKHTLVAHGKNSGGNYAKRFSNTIDSKKSSLGFFITGETYRGQHGYSLRIDGVEDGINDNVRVRDIVVHGSEYVSHTYAKQKGRLGLSWGCPALPESVYVSVIDKIKNGSLFYIYARDKQYEKATKFIPESDQYL